MRQRNVSMPPERYSSHTRYYSCKPNFSCQTTLGIFANVRILTVCKHSYVFSDVLRFLAFVQPLVWDASHNMDTIGERVSIRTVISEALRAHQRWSLMCQTLHLEITCKQQSQTQEQNRTTVAPDASHSFFPCAQIVGGCCDRESARDIWEQGGILRSTMGMDSAIFANAVSFEIHNSNPTPNMVNFTSTSC